MSLGWSGCRNGGALPPREGRAIACVRLVRLLSPLPLCGRGWRANASRERALVAAPLSPLAFARDPLPAARGEGTKSQRRRIWDSPVVPATWNRQRRVRSRFTLPLQRRVGTESVARADPVSSTSRGTTPAGALRCADGAWPAHRGERPACRAKPSGLAHPPTPAATRRRVSGGPRSRPARAPCPRAA